MASCSHFLIVPDTRTTRNTHGREAAADEAEEEGEGVGRWVIKESAAQTSRWWARAHRTMAVEVADERYLTVFVCAA